MCERCSERLPIFIQAVLVEAPRGIQKNPFAYAAQALSSDSRHASTDSAPTQVTQRFLAPLKQCSN